MDGLAQSNNPESRFANRFLRWCAAATVVIGMAAFTGCPANADFDDYEGVNLIGTRRFSGGDWTPDDATGAYMHWEVVSVSPPSGSSDTVYRMEVLNLFQNGDFEGVVLPGGWDYNASPPASSANPSIVTTPDINAIDNDTLQLQLSDNTQRIYTNLAPASRLADGLGKPAFAVGETFAVHMDLIPNSPGLEIELIDGNQKPTQSKLATLQIITNPLDIGTLHAFPADYPDATTNTITIKDEAFSRFSIRRFHEDTQRHNTDSIDNIRFVRVGPQYLVRTDIPYSDRGRPDLIPGGTYTISIAVRRDPTIGTGGRFAARQIALGLARISGDTTAPYMQRVDISSIGTSWTRVSVEAPGPGFSNTGFDGSDPILGLAISPTFVQGGGRYTDAGSVLVCDPRLSWTPD